MTACPRIPRVLFCRQWRSADEIEALASRWRAEIARAAGERAVAAVVPGTPEGVALIAALSSLPFPAILLTADRRALPGQPPLPPGTAVVVPPSVAHATPWVEAARWDSPLAAGVAGPRLRSWRRRTCTDLAESGIRHVFIGIDGCSQTCVPPDRRACGRGRGEAWRARPRRWRRHRCGRVDGARSWVDPAAVGHDTGWPVGASRAARSPDSASYPGLADVQVLVGHRSFR